MGVGLSIQLPHVLQVVQSWSPKRLHDTLALFNDNGKLLLTDRFHYLVLMWLMFVPSHDRVPLSTHFNFSGKLD